MSSRYVLQAADWCSKVLHSFIVATRPVVAVEPECFLATFQHHVVRGLTKPLQGMQPRGTFPPLPTKPLPPHVAADALPTWVDCPSKIWLGQYLPERSTDEAKRACLWMEDVLTNRDPEYRWDWLVKEGLDGVAGDDCIEEHWYAHRTRCQFAFDIWGKFINEGEFGMKFSSGFAC